MQPTAPKQPRFLDPVRLVCRRSHFSPRTEEANIFWIRRFVLFRGKRHHSESELVAFFNHSAGRTSRARKVFSPSVRSRGVSRYAPLTAFGRGCVKT